MKKLVISVNEQPVHECDKEPYLDDTQRAFLDKMDADMQRGIKIRGELISDPDARQKATFVAMNLIRALQQENEAVINVSCAYLVSRQPRVIEVQMQDTDDGIAIHFIDDLDS